MTKLNEYLRKVCAIALAMVMALSPVASLSIAEGEDVVPAQATQEPTATPTVEPTKEPIKAPTTELTQPPVESKTPAATPVVEESVTPTDTPVPTQSTEPDEQPSPSPDASTSPEVSPEGTPEASEEPLLYGIALLAEEDEVQSGTLTPATKTATLLSDGDSWQWKVTSSVSKSINYSVEGTGSEYLSISESGVVTTKKVTAKVVVTIAAEYVDKTDKETCDVTILPAPNSVAFLSEYANGIYLSVNSAQGYNLKQEDETTPRYTLGFDSTVTADATDYEDLIRFRLANNRIPLNVNTGELTNQATDYATVPVEDKVTVLVRADGAKTVQSVGAITLRVSAVPSEIVLNATSATIPKGSTFKPSFFAKSESGATITLDDSAFELVIYSGNSVELVNNELAVRGIDVGIAEVYVRIKGLEGDDEIASDPITITVQNVPTGDNELMLVDTDTNMTMWSGAAPDTLAMGLNQQLSLQVKLINSKNNFYIGKVTASSSSASRVGVSVNANNIITLSAKALTDEDVTVTINVNDDLSAPVPISLKVAVKSQPTEIRLSETSYSLCAGDSFTLVAIPLPEGNSTTGYTYTVSDPKVVKVERIQTPTNSASANGYFKITALENAVATGATTASATVTITSTGGNKPSATSTITVGRTPVSVGVEGSGSIAIPVNQQYRLRPYLLGSDGTRFGGSFTFRSGTPGLVSVDADGVLEVTGAIDEDTYPLGVTVQVSSTKWPTLNVATVYVKSVDPGSINFYFDDSSYELSKGERITITPSFYPTNTKADITFALTPSNNMVKIEKTTSDGMGVVIRAKGSKDAVGEYQLTATAAGINISTSCTIVVGTAPTQITVGSGYTKMVVGQTIRPTFNLSPADARVSGVWYSIETFQPTDLTYTDSNGAVQQRSAGVAITDDQTTVTQQGVPPVSVSGNYTGTEITAVSTGFVRVEMRTKASAHNAGIRVQWLIEIVEAPTNVEYIDKQEDVYLLSGMQFTQKAAAYNQSGLLVDCAITYTSSDPNVATVNSSGVVTAKRTGSATASDVEITASVPGARESDTYNVHVYDSPTAVLLADNADSIELIDANHYQATIGVNETIRIIPSFESSVNITPSPMKYTTEGQGIVTATAVKNTTTNTTTDGDVKGVKAGKTEIVNVSAPNGAYADVVFNVLSRPTKLTITNTALSIGLDETLDMNNIVRVWKNNSALADDTVRSKLIFTCSNVQLASVNRSTGLVKINISRNADGSISQGDLNKVGQSFTITAKSVCSGVNSVSCKFTITNEPVGLLIDQKAPYVRENVINTVTMLSGLAADTREYRFEARFLPKGSVGYVDYFSNMSEDDRQKITWTLNEDSDAYNEDAILFVRTIIDSSGNSVLYLRAVNNKEGDITFTPATQGGTLSTALRIKVTSAAATVDQVEFETPITLAVKDTYQIVPTYTEEDVAADITYTSLNTTYLSVGAKTGMVTAKKAYAHPVTVRATWKNGNDILTKDISFKVVSAPTAIYFRVFDPSNSGVVAQNKLTSLNVYLGESEVYSFGYHFDPTNAMSSNVRLSISNSTYSRYVTAELTPAADGTSGVITLSRVPTATFPAGAIVFTLTASGRSRTFKVYLRDDPESLTISPRTGLELNPGDSITFKGTATGSGTTASGGTLYYTCDPAPGADSPVKSLNSHTGVMVINDTVDSTATVAVSVHSTAKNDDDIDTTNATATLKVLPSIKASDISGLLYYKGTKDKYDAAKDTYCVGDVLRLQCTYTGDEEFSRKYPVVFVTEDTRYVKVASSNNTATLTFLRQTPANSPITVYAVPSNLRYAPTTQGFPLVFNVLPKATSVKWSFTSASKETSLRKNGFKLNEQREIDLTQEYGMSINVLPTSSAPGVEVIGYSSNKKVATIEKKTVEGEDGDSSEHWILKTPVGAKGTATITFSNATKTLKDSFKVTVYALPTSIRLSPESFTIGVGMSKTVTATYVGGSAIDGAGVTVEPGNGGVAISQNNAMQFTVTGVQATDGFEQLDVTTEAEKSLAAAELNVRVYDGPTGITIDRVQCGFKAENGTPVLKVGETATITYTVKAEDLSKMMTSLSFSEAGDENGASVSWSGNKSLQKIDNKDIVYSINVKALTPGATTFKIASSNGQTAEQEIIVKEGANSVALNTPASPLLLPMWERDGEQPEAETFGYTLMDKNGNEIADPYVGAVTLTNSNESLIDATLGDDGTISVQPKRQGAKGTATIKLTAGGKAVSLKVTVTDVTNTSKTQLKLNATSITLVEGQRRKLSYTITNGIDTGVTFVMVGQKNVRLAVDEDGYLSAEVTSYTNANGKKWEGYVYAKMGSIQSNRIKVTVNKGPQNLDRTTISQNTIYMGVGESVSYKHVKKSGESYTTTFSYLTTDRHAVAVSTGGNIKGLKDNGTATITMSSTNHKGEDAAKVDVVVKKAPTAISIVDDDITSKTLRMVVGDKKEIVLHQNLLLGVSGSIKADDSPNFGSYKLTCTGTQAKKLVVSQSLGSNGIKKFTISALAKGTYNLTFTTFNNKSCKLKVIVTAQ